MRRSQYFGLEVYVIFNTELLFEIEVNSGCHSPRLTRVIVLSVYTQSDLNNRQKRNNKKLIYLTSQFMHGKRASGIKHVCNYSQNLLTWQIKLTCDKILIDHFLAKWSLQAVQISNLNGKSACKKNFTVQSKFSFSLEMKIERAADE